MPDIGSTQTRWSCTCFDAGHVLGRDDERLALALVGDDAPQFGDAVLDDDIDVAAPIAACRSAARILSRIAASLPAGGWHVAREARQRMHQIGAADDADHPSVRASPAAV